MHENEKESRQKSRYVSNEGITNNVEKVLHNAAWAKWAKPGIFITAAKGRQLGSNQFIWDPTVGLAQCLLERFLCHFLQCFLVQHHNRWGWKTGFSKCLNCLTWHTVKMNPTTWKCYRYCHFGPQSSWIYRTMICKNTLKMAAPIQDRELYLKSSDRLKLVSWTWVHSNGLADSLLK